MLLMAAVAFVATGCANTPTQTLNSSAIASMQGKTVTNTVRPKAAYTELKLANVTGAMLGGIVGALAVQSFQKTHQERMTALLPDIGTNIASELSAALQSQSGASPAAGTLALEKGATASDIAGAAKGHVNYVLDVETIMLGAVYKPTAWSQFDVKFMAKGTMVNADTGAVVASGFCPDQPDTIAKPPSYEELMLNDAALFRQVLAVEQAICVATLKKSMLAL